MGKKRHNETETGKIPTAEEAAPESPVNSVDGQVDTDQAEVGKPDSEQVELCEEDKLRLQVGQLEDRLLRTAAEFENYKKRMARQYQDMVRSANDSLILELLEVVDNFERALNHVEDNTDTDAYRKGTELIFAQMLNLLKKYDIRPIEAVGQPFDPNIHDAMMRIDTDEFDEGIIAVEVARGYRQGERVIRHSRVGVSTGKKRQE